jgi:hypothetical protein
MAKAKAKAEARSQKLTEPENENGLTLLRQPTLGPLENSLLDGIKASFRGSDANRSEPLLGTPKIAPIAIVPIPRLGCEGTKQTPTKIICPTCLGRDKACQRCEGSGKIFNLVRFRLGYVGTSRLPEGVV